MCLYELPQSLNSERKHLCVLHIRLRVPFGELLRVYTVFSLSYPRTFSHLFPTEATCSSKRKRQGLTMELLKATGGGELSQCPTDRCRQWPWMGSWALWHLLRGWAPPWLLLVARPWDHLAGKDRNCCWVHSSLSESSSFAVSSRLAKRKESSYGTNYTLAKSWLGRSQALLVEVRGRAPWKIGSWATLAGERWCNSTSGSNLTSAMSKPTLLFPQLGI